MSVMSTGLGREERGGVDAGGLDIVWGAAAIGRVIGRSPRQAYHLLSRGAIRAARQVGSQWCASRAGLREQFCGSSAEPRT